MGQSGITLVANFAAAFVSALCAFALLLIAGAKPFSNRPGFHAFLFFTPLVSLGIAGLVSVFGFLKVRSKKSS
jgi:ABC-type multidrug transport system permease subunit